MRELATAERVHDFMRALAAATREEAVVYLTGGATAVLEGWRTTTVDVDVKLVPESDALLRAIARERGHDRDLDDVRAMLDRGLVDADGLRAMFARIEAELHRFPAIDRADFSRQLERALA